MLTGKKKSNIKNPKVVVDSIFNTYQCHKPIIQKKKATKLRCQMALKSAVDKSTLEDREDFNHKQNGLLTILSHFVHRALNAEYQTGLQTPKEW